MVRNLDLWKLVSIGLCMVVFSIVPLAVITINYNSLEPVSALPLDYWLWLCLESAGWLLILALLRFLLPTSGKEALARLRARNSSRGVWIFVAVVFAAATVKGIFTGSFMGLAPAIIVCNLGLIALYSPKLLRKPTC
jgi:hypothetical protein